MREASPHFFRVPEETGQIGPNVGTHRGKNLDRRKHGKGVLEGMSRSAVSYEVLYDYMVEMFEKGLGYPAKAAEITARVKIGRAHV